MRVSILDDEPYAIEVLKDLLQSLNDVEIVGTFTNPYTAMEQLPHLQVDVLFLDIELGERHGIELAEWLHWEFEHLEVVFVTAHPEYALDAFEVSVIDYLLKPVKRNRLQKTITKIREKLEMYEKLQKAASQSKELYIYTMGSFRLLDSKGDDVSWRTKKVKELFVYLWHFRDKPVHKAKVIEDLWPEMRADKAISLLHTTVYQLRKTVRAAGVQKNPLKFNNDHYQLMISPESDVTEILKICEQDVIDHASVEKLLNLYDGDYLEEEDFPWVFLEGERIKKSVQFVLVNFIKDNIEVEENRFIVEKCLEKLLQFDLYNEEYMLMFMKFLISSNQLQQLKTLYRGFKIIYEGDLGMKLPEQIEELYKSQLL
ncbi:hypothetical protein CHH80_21405 [Bacillus sp. 7504-2]|nr:hypothetical protein CHH80_21405 [Bacillus sp. 7504-2]